MSGDDGRTLIIFAALIGGIVGAIWVRRRWLNVRAAYAEWQRDQLAKRNEEGAAPVSAEEIEALRRRLDSGSV